MIKKQRIILLSIGMSILFSGCADDKQANPTKESRAQIEESQAEYKESTSNKKRETTENTNDEANNATVTYISAKELSEKMSSKESFFVLSSSKNSEVEKYYRELLLTLSETVANHFYFIDSKEMKESSLYEEMQLKILGEEYDEGILVFIEDGSPKDLYSKNSKIEEIDKKELEKSFK